MRITMLQAKIHRATVTAADLHYEGSLSLDTALMDAAGMRPYQRIEVYNVNNGARFATYLIEAERHSGTIQINGAAAHLANPGDLVIIATYAEMEPIEAEGWQPTKVFVAAQNRIVAAPLPANQPRVLSPA